MTERQVWVGQLKINYKTAGNGQPFLIIHGWGSSSSAWIKTAEILANNGFMVLVPDLPGFGQSDKMPLAWSNADYLDFISKIIGILKLENFYLLGHSFGGSLAIEYGIKNSNHVKKIFLVAAAGVRKKTFKKRFLLIVSKIFKIFDFMPFYNIFRKGFYRFFVKSDYLSVQGVMKETYLGIMGQDISNDLKNLSVDTILIWGDKDDVTPLKDAKFMNKEIKNSKLVLIAGGTHDLERKVPDILAKNILENI